MGVHEDERLNTSALGNEVAFSGKDSSVRLYFYVFLVGSFHQVFLPRP
jgi:hypothetical protein